MCGKYGLTRGDLDAFAARSHARAAAAVEAGRFDEQIVAVEGFDREGNPVTHMLDEGVRKGTTAEKLGQLDTLIDLGVFAAPMDAEHYVGGASGNVTAGNASQIILYF